MIKLPLPWLHGLGHIGGRSNSPTTEENTGKQSCDHWGMARGSSDCWLGSLIHGAGQSFNRFEPQGLHLLS